MLENILFKSILDVAPYRAYIVEMKTNTVVYINALMKDSMHMFEDKYHYSKNIYEKSNFSAYSYDDKSIDSIEDSNSEFFDEISDRWFISHDKILKDSKKTLYKFTLLIDISEQKNNHGKIIQSHARLSIYTKHLSNTNEKLIKTKSLLQRKRNELKIINKNLQIIVNKQLKKLRKQDQLLFLYQKQVSLDNIMSVIAHQWKQPLHELSINNIFLNEKNKDPKISKIHKENNEIIQFLSSTIVAFQNFYQSFSKNNFNIKEAIEHTILILNSTFRQYNIKILCNFEDTLIELKGQKNIFSQVILSILENAICTFIERDTFSPKILIHVSKSKKEIFLSIKDNAGGINSEHLPYIFKHSKSFRKKSSSGLGLYISKLVIVEKFHGTIIATNDEEGAIFNISIPFNTNGVLT